MLSCSCDIDSCEWYYHPPDDFQTFLSNRRKRCCSCKSMIKIGSLCTEFVRIRSPYNDIEERILGDEVKMASWYMCEWCSEMYFNLEALGYCHNLYDSMIETMRDYWDLTGFTPANQQLHLTEKRK